MGGRCGSCGKWQVTNSSNMKWQAVRSVVVSGTFSKKKVAVHVAVSNNVSCFFKVMTVAL